MDYVTSILAWAKTMDKFSYVIIAVGTRGVCGLSART